MIKATEKETMASSAISLARFSAYLLVLEQSCIWEVQPTFELPWRVYPGEVWFSNDHDGIYVVVDSVEVTFEGGCDPVTRRVVFTRQVLENYLAIIFFLWVHLQANFRDKTRRFTSLSFTTTALIDTGRHTNYSREGSGLKNIHALENPSAQSSV